MLQSRVQNLGVGFLLALYPIVVFPVIHHIYQDVITKVHLITNVEGFLCLSVAVGFVRRSFAKHLDWINLAAAASMMLAVAGVAFCTYWFFLFLSFR